MPTRKSLAGERPTLNQRQQMAYNLGHMDAELGMDWDDCPFDENDDLCSHWETGFIDAGGEAPDEDEG